MLKTVMTEREDPGPSHDVRAVTTGDEPNVKIETMPWYLMVGVRSGRVYIQVLLAFLLAGGLNIDEKIGIPLEQFGNTFIVAMKLAVGPAVVSALQNLGEILGKLDVTAYAKFRA